ncbi:MAG: efflux RND transporter periplasmic adaptor subunit [Gammaproteobacteria bacterium]|nr:efflux RND transporter periplasmic adaptor subunit [Gammaproteobacteria bacterium]
MRNSRGYILLLLLGLIFNRVHASEGLPTMVTTLSIMPLEYQLDGVVEARRQATLSAEVAGKVEAVYFDVDDFVNKGDVVLKIRDREYRARLEKARAVLEEARANLQELQLDYDRNTGLRKQKLISQAVFDKSSAGLKAAQARMNSTQADLVQAEEQLGYTVVRAPYSGVVVQRHVEAGESTRPGQPFMTGYVPEQLRVSANVPQSIISQLRKRRRARVVLLEGGRSLEVEQITIHPFADPRNHSFPVRLDLPASQADIYPGMLVKIALTVGERKRLLVPQQALVTRSEINALYLRDSDGKLIFRQVRPGNQYADQIEILAGLDAGETVVLDPVGAGIEIKRRQDSGQ